MIRKILLTLLLLSFSWDVLSFFYLFLRSNDLSGFFIWLTGLIFLGLGFVLIKKKNFLGSIVLIVLSYISLQFVYEVDGTLFSMALLKYGPQVLIMNVLEILVLLFSVLYLLVRLWCKLQSRGKNHVSD